MAKPKSKAGRPAKYAVKITGEGVLVHHPMLTRLGPVVFDEQEAGRILLVHDKLVAAMKAVQDWLPSEWKGEMFALTHARNNFRAALRLAEPTP